MKRGPSLKFGAADRAPKQSGAHKCSFCDGVALYRFKDAYACAKHKGEVVNRLRTEVPEREVEFLSWTPKPPTGSSE